MDQFQPPVHKLPNGHPLVPPKALCTVATPPGSVVDLGVAWASNSVVNSGEPLYLVAEVRNHASVAIGNHPPYPTLVTWRWRSADHLDDGVEPSRVSVVPWRLESGASLALPVRVVAPDTPGEFELELGLVQEGVRWFVRPRPVPQCRALIR